MKLPFKKPPCPAPNHHAETYCSVSCTIVSPAVLPLVPAIVRLKVCGGTFWNVGPVHAVRPARHAAQLARSKMRTMTLHLRRRSG